jgi:multicomponent Na+:H+ antiporter subunit D
LSLGALEAGHAIVAGVLMLSSLLSVAYLLPIVARAFFPPAIAVSAGDEVKIAEAPMPCLIALCATALLCLVLFFSAGSVETLLRGLFSPR